MPFACAETRRKYHRAYAAEYVLGVRRSENVGEVARKMEERAEAVKASRAAWCAENHERRMQQQRERRRQARVAALAGSLERLNQPNS